MEEDINNQSPFNMPSDTLKSIRLWLDKISELSMGWIGGVEVDPNKMILAKYRMVGQLKVIAAPFISKHIEEVNKEFKTIELKVGKIKHKVDGPMIDTVIYSMETNNALDNFVVKIEILLGQYFVPNYNKGERFYV